MGFEENYEKFLDICDLLIKNRNDKAKSKVEKLILNHLDVHTSNVDLISHILATAMLKRVDNELLETKNIYLQTFDIPQIILFYKMAEAYPQVAMSHSIANQYLESKIKDFSEVTLFDIGIGKGKQLETLLKRAAEKKYPIKKVNIIGLDPDETNLNDCKELFVSLNNSLPFEISYFAYCNFIEQFTEEDFNQIKEIGQDHLFINSAYSMHHISHPVNDLEYRTEIFKKLKSLSPVLFVLTEPNSNHDEEKISRRLHNCYHHFSTVFDLIDQSNISDEHRYLIKEKFFGREIRDMFSVSDYLRTERHESSESWLFRLARSGFTPYSYQDVTIDLPDYCSYDVSDGFVALGYQDINLIGIFAYQGK